MAATANNKVLARQAARAFGGQPSVNAYWDDARLISVDLLRCPDTPTAGITSFSTLGLSDHALWNNDEEFHARIELVGACAADIEVFPRALATSAFYIMRDRWFCRPGVVFELMLSANDPSARLPHLYFTAPSHWPELNTTVQLDTKKVTWLWAIPISSAESDYISRHGNDQFETLLEQSGANVFDLTRESIV